MAKVQRRQSSTERNGALLPRQLIVGARYLNLPGVGYSIELVLPLAAGAFRERI